MSTTIEAGGALDAKVSELVAVAAAVGSNCEACFRSHYETARTVGLSSEEIVQAVRVAHAVKETPARRMLELAARKLDVPVGTFAPQAATVVADGQAAISEEGCGCEAAPAQRAELDAEATCC